MKQYLILHKDHTPPELQGGNPRDLDGVYFVHSDADGTLAADMELQMADGVPVLDKAQRVAAVTSALYGNTGVVRLRQTEAREFLDTPEFRVFAGRYNAEPPLQADAAAVGVTPVGPDLQSKIQDAQTKHKQALTS